MQDLKTVRANGLGETPDEMIDCGPLGTMRVPGEWIDFLTKYSDIFRTDHSGYWMYGVSIDNGDGCTPEGGWLAYEHGDDARPTEEEEGMVENAHQDGEPLPERWFLIDKAFAIKAYVEGAKKWGLDWYDERKDNDATTYDWVVQMAALGEARYG